MTDMFGAIWDTVLLGGPVLILLLIASVLSLALFGVKVQQFRRAGVGQHDELVKLQGAGTQVDPSV